MRPNGRHSRYRESAFRKSGAFAPDCCLQRLPEDPSRAESGRVLSSGPGCAEVGFPVPGRAGSRQALIKQLPVTTYNQPCPLLSLTCRDLTTRHIRIFHGHRHSGAGTTFRWTRCRKTINRLRAMVSVPKCPRQCRGRRAATGDGGYDCRSRIWVPFAVSLRQEGLSAPMWQHAPLRPVGQRGATTLGESGPDRGGTSTSRQTSQVDPARFARPTHHRYGSFVAFQPISLTSSAVQFSLGLSRRSITSTSTGLFCVSNRRPSCSRNAVTNGGAGASASSLGDQSNSKS